MSVINRLSRFVARGAERGSALLISLMVLVGLSLIGLGYVALSETEGAIAANERNAAQTLHIAEAAGLMVIEWFQNPKWARDQGLAPANTDAIKVQRKVTREDGTVVYTGRYKSAAGAVLFDKPYKPLSEDRFFGTEDNPDILINDKTAPDFMAAFNIALFNNDPDAAADDNCTGCDNQQGGRVTEIRIYAPPIDGGFRNNEIGWDTPATSGIPVGRGFHYRGSRFGLATIRVTAAKFNRPDCGVYVSGCRVISERNVKMVVAEWPFPGPGGPIQSNANIGTTGNYHIHWGKITATENIDLKRPYVGIPFIDAYVRGGFERGYEAAVTGANVTLQWPTDLASADRRINRNYLYELIGLSFEDPWYQARARGTVTQMPDNTDPHDLRWNDITQAANAPACNPCNAGDAKAPGQSNMFQLQNKSQQTDYTNSLFPRVDYDFWKQVAVSADAQDNVYYLSWVSKDVFRDRHGNERTFRQWVDVKADPPAGTGAKSKAGFYFFDTENKLNPQNNRGGLLTDTVSIQGGGKDAMQMQGFIYLNSESLNIQGIDGYAGYYNMPGEVYRDVGFRKVQDAANYAKLDPLGVACTATVTTNCVTEGYGDGKFSYQDLEWSNGGTAKNGELDIFVAQGTINPQRTGSAPLTEYFPVMWFPGCVPGRNGVAGVNCSEPHEPYLNFIYPDPASPLGSITVRWQAPGAETRRRKTNPAGAVPNAALPSCAGADIDDCTSNSWDENGALVAISPILDGVLYNEGEFGSAGNAHYFGSLLFERDVEASGTPNIWFDEKLVKGMWPPGSFGFPRVYITTYETDQ